MATALRRIVKTASWGLVVCLMLLPIVGVVLGLWPSEQISLNDLSALMAYQGLGESVLLSLFSALVSSLLGFYLAFVLYSQYQQSHKLRAFDKLLAPLLSLPHLAFALGLVFLFSSGGLFFADFGLPRKGLSTMMLAIVSKEVPFFLLIFSAIGRQLPLKQWLLQSQALGYQRYQVWWLVMFPAFLKQSRLALIAATAYTLSVVDISMLVGPNVPELIAVSIYRWQSSFAAGDQALAFWGNGLLILLLAVSVLILYAHEKLAAAASQSFAVLGSRLTAAKSGKVFTLFLPLLAVLTVLIVAILALWSVGFKGQVQDLAFSRLSLQLWQNEWFFYLQPLQHSLWIGILAAVLGVGLALLALELQRQNQQYWPDYFWLLAIILPQLSMVLGWQILHNALQGDFNQGWIVLSHLPFTFAYAYLVLKGPFISLAKGYELLSASFGYSLWARWWRVRLRLLLPAIFIALAIAFSVSIAQYIPTLMIGAGRVATITTEAVTIGTGSQQDLTALYILLQSSLPFLAFLLAALLTRRFRASHGVSDA